MRKAMIALAVSAYRDYLREKPPILTLGQIAVKYGYASEEECYAHILIAKQYLEEREKHGDMD